MQFLDTMDNTLEHATRAHELMRTRGIPASPRNYEIVYTYVSGSNPNLVRTIDTLLSNGRELSSEMCAEIYEQFFSREREQGQIDDVGRSLQLTVAEVGQLISKAGGDTSRFGDIIEGLSGELTPGADEAGIKAVLNKVIGETRAMTERTRELEANLENASSEIKRLRTKLDTAKQEAMTDILTGIGNRKCFDEKLREAMIEAMEEDVPLSLLIGDIDHFKKFNDTWGHQLGDQVLKLVAHHLRSNTKGQDTPARYGGEEFGVILPRTTLKHAIALADKIRCAVSAKKMKKRTTGESIGHVTMSLGVATYQLGEPVDALIKRADTALYAAKRAGRNRVMCETDIEDAAPAQRKSHNAKVVHEHLVS